MKLTLAFILVVVTGCGRPSGRLPDRAQSDNLDKRPASNPKVDRDYYYPADSASIVTDTDYAQFHVRTTIFPLPDSCKIAYREYLDSLTGKRDRIRYRDYALRCDIKSTDQSTSISHIVSKYEFTPLMRLDPTYYVIRNATFVGYDKGEFQFDIALSWMDSKKRYLMVKYYISKDNASRSEDYPPDFYENELSAPE